MSSWYEFHLSGGAAVSMKRCLLHSILNHKFSENEFGNILFKSDVKKRVFLPKMSRVSRNSGLYKYVSINLPNFLSFNPRTEKFSAEMIKERTATILDNQIISSHHS